LYGTRRPSPPGPIPPAKSKSASRSRLHNMVMYRPKTDTSDRHPARADAMCMLIPARSSDDECPCHLIVDTLSTRVDCSGDKNYRTKPGHALCKGTCGCIHERRSTGLHRAARKKSHVVGDHSHSYQVKPQLSSIVAFTQRTKLRTHQYKTSPA